MAEWITACIPIAVLMIGALTTRKILESMFIAVLTGCILIYRVNFFNGFIEMIYNALSNSSLQYILIILVGFGGMIKLLQSSGAFLGFGDFLSKYANGKKKPLILAWLLGIIVFVGDYLNALTVTLSMRGLTDRNHIPREALAIQAVCLSGCVPALVPFSAWAGFNVGLISDVGLSSDYYTKAVPYMFFPICALIIYLLLDMGVIPKMGPLKSAYERGGGKEEKKEKKDETRNLVSLEINDDIKPSSPWNTVIPLATTIVGSLIYDNEIIHGCILALLVQFIIYLKQKLMTVGQFITNFLEGVRSMSNMALLSTLAFMLSIINRELGFFTVIENAIGSNVSKTLFPAMIFIIVAIATFATAGYWIMQIIAVPIFIPAAQGLGIDAALALGCIMSGVAFGCAYCFYSDAIFLTMAGTGVSAVDQVKAATPYTVGAAVMAALLYIILGVFL